MELTAVRELLRAFPRQSLRIQTDSQYVINVFTKWLPGWRANGMRTSSRKAVENQDLIAEIDELLTGRHIDWQWVRGHSGHPLNTLADRLALYAAERARTLLETGTLPKDPAMPARLLDR